MRTVAKLATVLAGYTTLFGCSAPDYRAEQDLGTYAIDLAGPVELVLAMEVTLEDPAKMRCGDLFPSFEIDWAGDEGDVTLQVWAGDERWDEVTTAEDGTRLTAVWGELRRCRFEATVLIDAEEPLQGEVTITAVGSHDGFSDTRGRVDGEVQVVAADE